MDKTVGASGPARFEPKQKHSVREEPRRSAPPEPRKFAAGNQAPAQRPPKHSREHQRASDGMLKDEQEYPSFNHAHKYPVTASIMARSRNGPHYLPDKLRCEISAIGPDDGARIGVETELRE